MAKRKPTATPAQAIATVRASTPSIAVPLPPLASDTTASLPHNIPRQRASRRPTARLAANPSAGAVINGLDGLGESLDENINKNMARVKANRDNDLDSPLSGATGVQDPPKDKRGAGSRGVRGSRMEAEDLGLATAEELANQRAGTVAEGAASDLEPEGNEEADEEEIRGAVSRPPPVNSDYLPLPWKGRLGYACLNTYLRSANPPVFSSRTCRVASILEHRHPLKDPSQPEHPIKNRPDKDQPPDIARGQAYVEGIGLANSRDIVKMLRWNDRYGIKFMRLSSEMFPFASHEEYGYKLAPFAADTLREVGKVVAELGHRVTTHPGQFTQLGSPRQSVIGNAVRDLEYQDEMLSLLRLPSQMDRDAVIIIHMGGAFGDKAATLDRFRENYAKLSQSIKNRLVLENDDVTWSVHDLLPVCQELNIPLVLDFHHHNIVFDKEKIREGTKDIIELFPAILETWSRKAIRPKMHYSESVPSAISPMQRRKHSPRVATLPPCPNDIDLMIEAKDKEQAVFELMRNFKLPGWDTFNDMIPHVRDDENKPVHASKKVLKRKRGEAKQGGDEPEAATQDMTAESVKQELQIITEEEAGMGGPEKRVYWPPGMEEWLRPAKRVIGKAVGEGGETKLSSGRKRKARPQAESAVDIPSKKGADRTMNARKRAMMAAPAPVSSGEDVEDLPLSDVLDQTGLEGVVEPDQRRGRARIVPVRKSARAARTRYAEVDMSD